SVAIDNRSNCEHIGKIKYRVSRRTFAIRIEARNFQAGWAQRDAGRPDRVASADYTRRCSCNWQCSGIHTRISKRCWVSDVIALAFVGEKEKGLILLQRPTNSGTELAQTNFLFLAFAEENRNT